MKSIVYFRFLLLIILVIILLILVNKIIYKTSSMYSPELLPYTKENMINMDIENQGNIKNPVILPDNVPGVAFPFKNLYASPETLGIDRMILASGAVLQFQDVNRLVIDAGTCVTYDFIDTNNNYLGGAISPGIGLRYESLHNYTAKLPLLTRENPKQLIGNSTEQSIHSGVINGLIMEIEGFINSNLYRNDNFIIILTGGDADFLAERLKNTIFANSNFLLESLNQIFQYNQQ